MKEYHRKTGKKVILYLVSGIPAFYYEGAVHPTKSEDGTSVMLNQKMIDMMIPLLKEQPFIEDVKIWVDEKIEVPLGTFRDTYVGMPSFSINRWYFYVFPDLACDLSGVWLNVPDAEKDLAKGKIMITRSERYLNPAINYSFLKPYEDDLIFCGTMREYNVFCMTYDLNIKKLTINNFLELAQAIKQCKFHMTNQTQAFQLSESQKIPRILELCGAAPNCIPIGEKAYDFFAQEGLESYFHELNGTSERYFEEIKKTAQ
jgi:cellulose synthase/poly-beta-1,6-N-acetylglucosamine synthase-like glycosyltransferase